MTRTFVGFRTAFVLGLMIAAISAHGQTTAPASRTSGKWLVDLGRDYPLSPQASLTDADAEVTLAFMEAAARIEPTLAEARLWQYNMLWALRREGEAADALHAYARIQKDDAAALTSWIAVKTDTIQDLEQRVDFWREQAKQSGLPAEAASDLQRRLAEYHFNRGETAEALKEVTEALRLFPENIAARQLAFQVEGDTDNPAGRLSLALDMVRMNPSQTLLVWDLAMLLDEQSMHRDALRWYQQAQATYQLTQPGQTLPADFLLDMATSQLHAGLMDSAEKILQQVITRQGDLPRAHRVMARLMKSTSRTDEARRQLEKVRSLYDEQLKRNNNTPTPELAAEIAWYYCVEDPNVERAYELSRIAMRAALPSVVARRAYGFAAAEKGLVAEAKRVLEPIALNDPWSSVALARACERDGDEKMAAALLTRVAGMYRSGSLFETASSRLTALKQPVPPAASQEEMTRLLTAFDYSVLGYAAEPAKYLELKIIPLAADGVLRAGQPLWCRFVLTSKAKFPISLGEELMVSPTVMVMSQSSGDRDRVYGGLQRVALNRRQILRPGETIELSQTLDVGPLRSTLLSTPQISQAIEVSGILSPAWSEELQQWRPRLGGFTAPPVRVTRKGVAPDDPAEGLAATIARAKSGAIDERVEATERLMMWLAESQHLAAKRLDYSAKPLDARVASAALVKQFADPDWQVRAHLAESLRWVVLENDLAKAASGLLNDPHWLVRMLSLRAFADHHGAKFDKVAAYYATSDADPLVRGMAAALRQRWTTTQPASRPAAATE